MKIKTFVEIKETTKEQLEDAYNLAYKDLMFSDEHGLDHANALRRCETIEKEAKRRGYNGTNIHQNNNS